MDGAGNGELEIVAAGDEGEVIYLPYPIGHSIEGVAESDVAAQEFLAVGGVAHTMFVEDGHLVGIFFVVIKGCAVVVGVLDVDFQLLWVFSERRVVEEHAGWDVECLQLGAVAGCRGGYEGRSCGDAIVGNVGDLQ
jgi:hypothetical protein